MWNMAHFASNYATTHVVLVVGWEAVVQVLPKLHALQRIKAGSSSSMVRVEPAKAQREAAGSPANGGLEGQHQAWLMAHASPLESLKGVSSVLR